MRKHTNSFQFQLHVIGPGEAADDGGRADPHWRHDQCLPALISRHGEPWRLINATHWKRPAWDCTQSNR